jgi:hypothetical protein
MSPIILGFNAKAPRGMKQAAIITPLQTVNWNLSAMIQNKPLLWKSTRQGDIPADSFQRPNNIAVLFEAVVNNISK